MEEGQEQFSRAPTTTQTMMNRCHIDDENWDVQLQVDSTIFKCRRSFLEANFQLFPTEFANFEESPTTMDQPILLSDIDATTFEKVLHFLHTGEIHLNDSNVLQCLYANEYLRLRTANVKEQCVAYLKSRSEESEPIPNALELLCFASARREDVLADIVKAHICQHLYHYSNDAQLKKFSLNNLKALLEFSRKLIVPSAGSGEIIMAFINNWFKHDFFNRRQYREELMKDIDLEKNVTTSFAVFLFDWMIVVSDVMRMPEHDRPPSEATRILQTGADLAYHDGNSRVSACISFTVRKVSEWQTGEEAFSPPCIISNLSWRTSIGRIGDDVSVNLHCDGTDSCPEWNCYAKALFSIKSHQDRRGIGFRDEISLSLFSSNMKPCKWGPKECLKWNDLIDPEKGYMKYGEFITLDVHVQADVPFLKTIQSNSGIDNTTTDCE